MLTSEGGANMGTLYSWLNTQPDKVSQFFVDVLAYIPFVLSLFNYIENNDALWCFDSFIKTLKKTLDCINQMVYTCKTAIHYFSSLVSSPTSFGFQFRILKGDLFPYFTTENSDKSQSKNLKERWSSIACTK